MALTDEQALQIQKEFNGLFLTQAGCDEIAAELKKHPWLINKPFLDTSPLWLCAAAKRHGQDVLQLLLDAGCNVNQRDPGMTETPLSQAIAFENYAVMAFLLEQGADPNLCRCLIGVLDIEDEDQRLSALSLLLEHGVDVNRVFPMFGDYDSAFTALDRAQKDVPAQGLLVTHGAMHATAITGRSEKGSDPLMAWMSESFGPVADRYWTDHVASGTPCQVHMCEPKRSRFRRKPQGPLTFFTYGLSWRKMPAHQAPETFRRAEIILQLSPEYPLPTHRDPASMWPIDWLNRSVNYPRIKKTWLGNPMTVLTGRDPAKPVIAGKPFSAMMLYQCDSLARPDGEHVQIYRMVPLLPNELESLRAGKGSSDEPIFDAGANGQEARFNRTLELS